LPDGANNSVYLPRCASPTAASNYRVLQNVVINEALAHTDPPLEDAIELHNPTASPVSINGWFLSNTKDHLRKYQITNAAPIPAGGFVVIYEYQFNNATTNAFTLKAAYDDEIWLTAMTNGVETGERATVEFRRVVQRRLVRTRADQSGRGFLAADRAEVWRGQPGQRSPSSAPARELEQRRRPSSARSSSTRFLHPPGGTNGSEEFVELRNNTQPCAALRSGVSRRTAGNSAAGLSSRSPPA
jgi:hypothetical protein